MREPIRVLHVDDQADFADLTATALEREDDRLSVEAVTSADEVLERLTDGVDCVVSDYDMPGRNGIEVLEAIRERYPDLPFILFTGKGSEEVASEAISAGVTDYLEKEGGLSQYTVLANRIRNAVDQYRSKRALEDSQRRLSLFVEQSPLGVVEWDEEFRIVSLNDAAEEILGYAESEVRGDSWERIVSDTDTEDVGAVVDALLENRGGYRSVNENVRADGEVIVCEWYNRVVTDDDSEGSESPRADGDVVAIFSQFQDITDRIERERRLERSTARLEALFENSPDMINVHDTAGNIIDPNPRLCERTGYDADELTEMKVWELDEVSDPETARQVWAEMEVGDRRRLDGMYRCRDGSTLPVEIHLQRLDLAGDERFVVISRDVSERMVRERELERYETIVETIDDVAMVIDPDRTVAYINETGVRYAGTAADDIVGQSIVSLASEFVAEAGGVERFERALDRAFDATPPVAVPERLELDVEAAVGRVVLEYQFSPVFEAGEATAVVVTMRDITTRTERERALEATKERLDTVVSNVPVVLFALDADGTFTLSEGQGLDALGWESGDVIGESAFDLYADNPAVCEAIERALDGEVISATQHIEDRFFETAYQPIVDDGSVTGVIGVATDVTERRRREHDLQRQNERLEEFVGVVSHDLRTPLAVAEGRVRLARDETDSEHLDAAARALDRMEELIDDLLRLAREGERVNEIEPVPLAAVVEECWDTVETRGSTLRVETDLTIRADRGQLQHLLANLLQNSVEHGSTSPRSQAPEDNEVSETPRETGEAGDSVEHGSTSSRSETDDNEVSKTPRADGEAVDSVEHGSTGSRSETDDDVTITVGTIGGEGFYVADDGPGIPRERRTDVFESGYSTVSDGTGFGLAIVAEVVEAHGWSIRVTESAAGGARFEVTGVDIVETAREY
jgi:PAS domain S-box-containing protein